MSDVTDSLFFASPFVRWSLGTTAFVTAVGFGLLMGDMRGVALCAGIAFEAVLVLLFLAMIAPTRCAIAARGVCAIVFLAYVAYAIDMGVRRPDSFWPPTVRQSESSGYNALCGMITIGVPALLFALYRRRPPQRVDETVEGDEDEFLTEEDELSSDASH